jgi:hypothetical protein
VEASNLLSATSKECRVIWGGIIARSKARKGSD